jgi:hypothetical protein
VGISCPLEVSVLHFNAEGLLPPGDYELTLEELRACILVDFPGNPTWDRAWRAYLVDNLAVLVDQLYRVGIQDVFIDGSFVEEKAHPNDIDGYFICDARQFWSGEIERKLNSLDPYACWTWDPARRTPYRKYRKKQLPIWHQYRVELYPHYGQFSGLSDEFGNELEFPAAFRRSRGGKPRGIIKIRRKP